MHTCYSLCTNKVLNLGLSNLNHPTRLLLSLALQRCFLAKQMGKRPQMDEWDMYLYPPIQNITVEVQLNKYRADRMQARVWLEQTALSDTLTHYTDRYVWSL